MACLKRGIFPAVARISFPLLAAFALAGCAKLTEPPKPEPMQIEPAASAAAAAPPGSGEIRLADMKKPAALAPSGKAEPEQPKPAEPEPPPPANEKLGVKDVAVGKGAVAASGDTVKVHYVGTLPDGKEFDASKKHGQPFEFQLGQGRVIKGWDQGVVGMKIGGKRKLTVPPSLGYGARGFPPVIPPNSTLNFDIELLEVKKK